MRGQTVGDDERMTDQKTRDIAARRRSRTREITTSLQRRLDLHKKLDAWFDKQHQRDKELGALLSELVELGEKPTQLASVLGMPRSKVKQIINEATESASSSDQQDDHVDARPGDVLEE